MLTRLNNGTILGIAIALLFLSVFIIRLVFSSPSPPPQLLTDPFLQVPTSNSVNVIWFTEFAGSRHFVSFGNNLDQTILATTTKLSRVREDKFSRVGQQTSNGEIYDQPVFRDIWRHEARIPNLKPNFRIPYRVTSISANGAKVTSDIFTLAAAPQTGTSLRILLTSDHQMMPMTAANLQKVVETVGQVDAVFLAGDLVNIPDRASEWFDDNRGGAFFPSLQGRAHYKLEKNNLTTVYRGGQIIQFAPLFTTTGNHEVMGRTTLETYLNDQFNDPYPINAAKQFYEKNKASINPNDNPKVFQNWLKENTFNTDTYNEIFTIPTRSSGQENYYAVTFGDIRLVSLYATNIWRSPNLGANDRGRFRERDRDLDSLENWGYGQHIFEPIAKGSRQYKWLEQELKSPEFQQAKYKIVMLHHPPHSLGDNIVPAYTDPVQIIDRDRNGKIKTVRYEYPLEADYLIRDVMPLLEQAKVQLVFFGHSHLWNRFISPSGMHFLESSNVGNTYHAYWQDKRRFVPPAYQAEYVAQGDPNGLEPIIPTLAPLRENNQPVPYLASNDITAFSILETATGIVSSYYFDTREPDSAVVKFDEFQLER